MRNLKKILALVLALVMSMSMLATANAFTDDESIDETFTEAVEVLSGLKVFQGRPDGSFDPKAGITRAEVAAIIYRIVSKDVEDKQVSIYADYNKFSDVNSASWYAGYVNFCANGLYIKGHDGKFAPNDPVTGYQALAMILRALGYDANGEFTGAGWEVRTATIAKSLGITDNIAAGTLGTAASREVVAEILFKAILASTVEYLPAFGYVPTEKSLGYENFELAKFEGVITANEYADLNGDSAIGEGKTEIDGVVYTNCSTDLTEIGENRVGYAAGKKVLTIHDEGNTVFETGAGTKITKANVGMGISDADFFLNFGGEDGVYMSDYRLEYILVGMPSETYTFGDGKDDDFETEADAKDAIKDDFAAYGITKITYKTEGNEVSATGDIEKVIKAEHTFNAKDVACMKYIFTEADKENNKIIKGEVYVGTKSTEDISDEISWKSFKNEYITELTDYAPIEDTVNGDWLKVIDNDGDGDAEYIFKTEFKMAQVIELTKKGVLTLTNDSENHELDGETVYGSATTEPFVTSADLAAGDVVLHTVIDGVAYVELAPSFTGEVDKYTYKTETLTVEGEDYEASEIDEHTGYEYDLEGANKKTEYTYFQDFFGFIRVFALPATADGELVLLTDGYYENNRKGDVYAVDAYLNDEVTDYDVSAKHTGGFIEDEVNDKNGWDKLVEFGDYNALTGYNPATTNLARYSLDENVMSLASAKTYTYDKRGNEDGIKTDYIDLKEIDFAKGETDFPGVYNNPWKAEDGFLADRGDVIVQANRDTVYYYVAWVNGEPVVQTVVGYKNAIGVVSEVVGLVDMYAVATNVHSDSKNINYWVADAIVIETKIPAFDLSSDVVLGYNVLNKTVHDYADLEAIKNDATLDELNVTSVDGYDEFDKSDIEYPWFYFNTESEDGDSYIRQITANYGKYGIYVATVDREADLYDYVVANDADHTKLWYDEETVVYTLDWNKKGTAIVTDTEDAKGNTLTLETAGDYIVYAPKHDVVYAIAVDSAKDAIDVAQELYDAILADANYTPVSKVAAATAALNAYTEINYFNRKAAEKALADVAALTPEDAANAQEWVDFEDAKAALQALIDAYDANATHNGLLNDVKGAYYKLIDDTAAQYADDPNAAWPEDCIDDAKNAVNDVLATKTDAELAEMKKAGAVTNSDVWTAVAKVVGEAQALVKAKADATDAVKKAYMALNPSDRADVEDIYTKALADIAKATTPDAATKAGDEAVAAMKADLVPEVKQLTGAELGEKLKDDKNFAGIGDYICDSIKVSQEGTKLTVTGKVSSDKLFDKTLTATVPGFGNAEKCLGYANIAGSTNFAFYTFSNDADDAIMIVGDKTANTSIKLGDTTYTIEYKLVWN